MPYCLNPPACLPSSVGDTALSKAHSVWVLFVLFKALSQIHIHTVGWVASNIQAHSPSGQQPNKSAGWTQPGNKAFSCLASSVASAVGAIGLRARL